jgi:protocatechuate 3,4-dioxygenase, alpha subunit
VAERGITPSQTVGPFFHFSLTPTGHSFRGIADDNLVTPDAVGAPIRIAGRLIDGAGNPVPDAMIEIWQADGAGRYAGSEPHANTSFKGFGRAATGKEGAFGFTTVRPGAVAGPDGRLQAPHINVGVFARGMLKRLFTRIYFEGEPGNASDAILALVPAERRATLLARNDGIGDGLPLFVFDIRLQGDGETVFFQA